MQVIVVLYRIIHVVKQTLFSIAGLGIEMISIRGKGASCTIQLFLQVSRAPPAPCVNSGL